MRRLTRGLRFCEALLFPRRCPFCDEVLGFSGPCAACTPKRMAQTRGAGQPIPPQAHTFDALDAIYAPYFYEDDVRAAVLRLKFEDRPDLADPLGAQQAAFLRAAGCAETIDAVCFVPSTRRRRKERGYDVPLLLARAIGGEIGKPILRALEKTRETEQQKGLSGQERRENLKGSIGVRAGVSVQGKRLLLVDDVITTGATMSACAEALRAAGAAACIGTGIAVVRQ